jgi:hypothetical protein
MLLPQQDALEVFKEISWFRSESKFADGCQKLLFVEQIVDQCAPLAKKRRSQQSVDIALVAFVGFQLLNVFPGRFIGASTSHLHDFMKSFVDIFGHPTGVTADIEMRPLLEPVPKLLGVLYHSGLNIDFVILIARKGRIQPG